MYHVFKCQIIYYEEWEAIESRMWRTTKSTPPPKEQEEVSCMHAWLPQLYPALCDPVDCSTPGSCVHGILQATIWSGLSRPPPRNLPNPGIEPGSLLSPPCIRGFFTTNTTWEAEMAAKLEIYNRILRWWSSDKESVLQCRRPQSHSWTGKIPWRKNRLPTPVFLSFPSGSDGKESTCNAGDLGSTPGLGRSPGEGYGYPLQYSGLANSMDRRTWWVTVHGVAKSWIWLCNFHALPW